MRKSFLYLLLLLLAVGLVACGGDADDEPAAGETTTETANTNEDMAAEETAGEPDCASAEVLCVGLVTDVGEVDDKSFNQSAWEGVQRAESELGATVDYIETQDAKDYAANIGLFADAGYDVIVTVGFALGEATLTAAAAYPDDQFHRRGPVPGRSG